MLDQNGFDLWADGYDRDVAASDAEGTYPFAGYHALLGRIYRAVREGVPTGGAVLDVGFGTGTLLKRLYDDGYNVTGIDFSESMIEAAKAKMMIGIPDGVPYGAESVNSRRRAEARLFLHDLGAGLPDAVLEGRFDAIIATYALHHLEETAHSAMLAALFRLLKPGGLLLVGDVAFAGEAERNACRVKYGEAWDDAEFYPAYEVYRQSLGVPITFEAVSHCAGIVTIKKPRMALFDYGGTLCEEGVFDGVAATEALMRHATENRFGLSPEEVSSFSTEHFDRLDPIRLEHRVEIHNHPFSRFVYEYLGLAFDIPPVEQELAFWDAGAPLVLRHGVDETLAALARQGIRTGVISNMGYSGAALERRITRLFPDHAFEFIIASSEYVYRKPSPLIFEFAARKARLSPGDIWYLGNRFDCDVEGPLASGMQAVWTPERRQPRALPKGCAVIEHWKELTAWFA